MATKITVKKDERKQMTYGDLKQGDIFSFGSDESSRVSIRMKSGYCRLDTGRMWCANPNEVVVVYDAEIILTERK